MTKQRLKLPRWTFTLENDRSLVYANNGTTSISYAYDANTVDAVTHNYLYASGQLLQETYGDNTLDFSYDANGHHHALNYNGTTYYCITNLQGDVMYLVEIDHELLPEGYSEYGE